jgi:hypothetical protein
MGQERSRTEGEANMAKDKSEKWDARKMLSSLAQDRRFMSIARAWSELTSEHKDELEGMVETWTAKDGD